MPKPNARKNPNRTENQVVMDVDKLNVEIISVESSSKVPPIANGYCLAENEPIESAFEQYIRKFNTPPQKGWRWRNLLYLELPDSLPDGGSPTFRE